MEKKRERFDSHVGMILAMAGSAVGLGNLWRFPFLAAQNGGGAFIFVYLILLLTICIPVLMTEITLGRKCRTNVTRVYDNLGAPRWRWAGFITLLTPIVIMAFYTVVGGWSVKYLIQACAFNFTAPDADYAGAFSGFISSTWEPLVYTLIFLVITAAANFGGVKNGIERFSKPMMTVLSVTIILVAIRSLTLPGASEGTKYLLIPDFSKIDGKVLITALGQAFMSLSIGIGILLTYGSYVKTKEDIAMTAITTGLIDTLFHNSRPGYHTCGLCHSIHERHCPRSECRPGAGVHNPAGSVRLNAGRQHNSHTVLHVAAAGRSDIGHIHA